MLSLPKMTWMFDINIALRGGGKKCVIFIGYCFYILRVLARFVVRKQLAHLNRKINVDISPVYTSRKITDEIKVREDKPPLVSQQCVVYSFQCGLCDAGYVGYTCRYLHQRIEEHKGSAIGNHLREQHNMEPKDIAESFRILRKCQNKFDCLICWNVFFFFIKEL